MATRFGGAGDYALGAALTITTTQYINGGVQPRVTRVTNSYNWWDGAVANTTFFDADIASTAGQDGSTGYLYDTIGGSSQLARVSIADGRPRVVYFTNDSFGQTLARDEADQITGPGGQYGDPHERWYRFGGRQQAYVGNNGSYDIDYNASIANRTTVGGTGPFVNGSWSHTSTADFDQAYESVNSFTQGSNSGMYTIQAGDTLSSIAANLWGDASLWYKLAEVNGLTADTALVEGLPLIIPAGVVRNTNNAGTYQPYDPLEVLGNVSPTAPMLTKQDVWR